MSDEWGPWIEHDGEHVPDLGAAFIDAWVWGVWEKAQRRAPDGPPFRVQFRADEMHPDNWIIGPNDCCLVVRYRIRKPRGLTILEAIAENPREEEPADCMDRCV